MQTPSTSHSTAPDRYWLAFDVGGTFVDVLSFDLKAGRIEATKHRSARATAADSVREGLESHLSLMGAEPAGSARLAHGTTLVTNLLVERTGARVGVITTRGFRDVLEIGRMRRPSLYDLTVDKPSPLAARPARAEVTERIDARGRVLVPLDENDVAAAADSFRAQRVETIAVCFLHSYANPVHERQAASWLRDAGFFVSLSSEVSPEFGEFERFSTAVINAFAMPAVGRYLDELDQRRHGLQISVPLQIMQSNGGVISSPIATRFPVRLTSSGPAAGVIGAAILSARAGFQNLITLDMGGTSTDVALVAGGEIGYASEQEIGGHPVRTVGIDIRSIGAGGGSIASIDRTGALRTGPESAGADPGPACYGWGGEQPTVADADLILGYLNPQRFCGGRMILRQDLAQAALDRHIARPRKVSVDEAAIGVLRVCVTNMVGAVRNITMQQGYDPRDFVLAAFGGAGAVHATFVAAELHIPRVLILRDSGMLSAKGLLLTNYRVDEFRTYARSLGEVDCGALSAVFRELEDAAVAQLAESVGGRPEVQVRRVIEFCYEGQQSALPVDVGEFPVTPNHLASLAGRFGERFQQLFGFVPAGREPQILHVRVFVEHDLGALRLLESESLPVRGKDAQAVPSERRDVLFPGESRRLETRVYERDRLRPGDVLRGPAVVEEDYTNTIIGPGQHCRVDGDCNLVIETGLHGGTGGGG